MIETVLTRRIQYNPSTKLTRPHRTIGIHRAIECQARLLRPVGPLRSERKLEGCDRAAPYTKEGVSGIELSWSKV
jgi:hypothetical protein